MPLDGSPLAEQAIPLALEIARAARSKVRLVLVHQSPPPPFYEESAELYVSIELATRKSGRDYLRRLAAQLRHRSGLQISSVTLDGSADQALVKYVNDIGADLVAMTTHGRGGVRAAWLGNVADQERIDLVAIATHGRSGVRGLVLGSVADKLIRAAGPAVLVVRPGKGRSNAERVSDP